VVASPNHAQRRFVRTRADTHEKQRADGAGDGDGADWCNLALHVCLAADDAEGAAAAVAPVLAGTAFAFSVNLPDRGRCYSTVSPACA